MYVIKALQAPYRKAPARHPLFRRPIPTQNRRKFLRRFCVGFFQTIRNVKRRRYKDRQSAALDRAVLWNRSPKRKRELQSPIYFAFFNFLRFCKTKAVVYFAFSFFVAMRGIETTAILTNRSTRNPQGEQTKSAIKKPPKRTSVAKPCRKRMAGTTYAMPAI